MYLNFKEIQWLNQRGGRNEEDVYTDEYGKYVWMGSGSGGSVKVYLPDYKKENDEK